MLTSLRHRSVIPVVLFAIAVSGQPSPAQDSASTPLTATVEGSKRVVRTVRSDGRLLLNVSDLAAALGQEAKAVSNGQLLTFCRTGDEGLCIPIPLRNVPATGKGDSLFVDASVLARALRLEVDNQKTRVVLRPATGKRDDETDIPAFNAAWGEGRGFRPGQTLPDIPLMDMDGREVRFSQFLGKRYIIYCWASW